MPMEDMLLMFLMKVQCIKKYELIEIYLFYIKLKYFIGEAQYPEAKPYVPAPAAPAAY